MFAGLAHENDQDMEFDYDDEMIEEMSEEDLSFEAPLTVYSESDNLFEREALQSRNAENMIVWSAISDNAYE
jgi:hypothetical protein